jgi:hypothetical protein
MLREWRALGSETHSSSDGVGAANQTGEAHGRPSASAVPRVMYLTAASSVAGSVPMVG